MISLKLQLRREDFHLQIDTRVPETGVTALFGASGCGKTSLLRCIAGLETSCMGRIDINGSVWQDDAMSVRLPPHRRSVAYVFQHAALFPHLDVAGNLRFAGSRAGKAPLSQQDVIAMTGIGALLQRNCKSLSGGERQRVALARALLSAPSLLLLDEPMAALDRSSKAELMPYLEQLHRDLAIPVIYVSHSLDEVARLADHMLFLEQGRIAAQGALSDALCQVGMLTRGEEEAVAVIHATVAEHDEAYHLSGLRFSGGTLWIPREELGINSRVRVSVHARDVSLALHAIEDTSILNIFQARIEDIADSGPAQSLIRLSVGEEPILCKLTRKSVAKLRLAVGMQVYAQVKSVSLAE